jgi:outer membrane lipoprotein SlyB
MNKFKFLFVAVCSTAFLSSCAKNLESTNYVDSSTVGIVYEGTVVSARVVTIKSSDKLGEKPGIGTLGGGLAGGIGGSQIGKGKGSAAGAVGGALAGAVLGAIIEDQLGKQQGMEYLVKLSDDSLADVEADQNKNYRINSSSVEDKLRGSTKMGLKSKVISVVQGLENPVQVGQKVYVVYNDDRPRVVPAF